MPEIQKVYRKDLLDTVNSKVEGVSKEKINEIISTVTDVISEALERGDRVILTGFGTFNVRTTSERRGVDPNTQRPMTIPAGRKVRFASGGALKRRLK